MSNSMQDFLADATAKAASNLEAALLRVPADKRLWAPVETSRSALDIVAECAILNASSAQIIMLRKWDEDFPM